MNVKTIGKVLSLSTTLVIFCCSLAMFGCDRGSSGAGKYLSEKNSQEFTELKSDGTFLVHQANLDLNGKYKISGKQLNLSLSTGEVIVGTIVGKSITDNEGKVWTKQ